MNIITLFHGTNSNIKDGLASGTFFTDDINIAIKYGNNIYCFTGDKNIFCKDIFNEHYTCSMFIPLNYLNKLKVINEVK